MLLVIAAFAVANAQQAQTGSASDECALSAITITASLGVTPGVSDTLPSSAVSRTVYLAEPDPSGLLTVSVLVSNVSASCYVWTSPAFSVTSESQFTLTASVPSVEVPYPVGNGQSPSVTLLITSSVNVTGSTPPYQVATLTFVPDITPPTSTLQAPVISNGHVPIPVDWSAGDAGSGALSLTLFYQQLPMPGWNVYTTTPVAGVLTGTLAFTPPTVWVTGPITYELTSQAVDFVGNQEPRTSKGVTVQVSPFVIYLPVIMRDYRQLTNGDFEQDWTGWTHGQGPFLGHGSGLPQSIVSFDGSHRALLGDPVYDTYLYKGYNFPIPVGYAYMEQQFTVPSGTPILSIMYRVHSLDTSFGLSETLYFFDTFEVSINTPSDQITDTERNGSYGCRGVALNPDNLTRTPSSNGLIVCGGAPAASSGGALWDSGWRTVRLDLTAFAGSSITLYFANWNREYGPPYWDDKGFFNTYSYVDNVQFVTGP